jgi:hypothetical protein
MTTPFHNQRGPLVVTIQVPLIVTSHNSTTTPLLNQQGPLAVVSQNVMTTPSSKVVIVAWFPEPTKSPRRIDPVISEPTRSTRRHVAEHADHPSAANEHVQPVMPESTKDSPRYPLASTSNVSTNLLEPTNDSPGCLLVSTAPPDSTPTDDPPRYPLVSTSPDSTYTMPFIVKRLTDTRHFSITLPHPTKDSPQYPLTLATIPEPADNSPSCSVALTTTPEPTNDSFRYPVALTTLPEPRFLCVAEKPSLSPCRIDTPSGSKIHNALSIIPRCRPLPIETDHQDSSHNNLWSRHSQILP